MTTLKDIPHINLLCMEDKYIKAYNDAVSTHWPSLNTLPAGSGSGSGSGSCPSITIHNNPLRTLPSSVKFQLVVSPANSYGRLDGAFDDAISRAFCLRAKQDYGTLTAAAQRVLYERWRGFAPPGTCTLVPFPRELLQSGGGDDDGGANPWGCEWVAICPTMRMPTNVSWDREVVYECVWSLLCEVERHNRNTTTSKGRGRIDSILITPLATGVGRVSPERWAAQFVLALKHFVDALERPERWSQMEWMELGADAMAVEKTWKEKS